MPVSPRAHPAHTQPLLSFSLMSTLTQQVGDVLHATFPESVEHILGQLWVWPCTHQDLSERHWCAFLRGQAAQTAYVSELKAKGHLNAFQETVCVLD